MLKISFFGSGLAAAIILGHLASSNYIITSIVSHPDKKKERGMNLQSSPVAQLAKKLNLPLKQPDSIKDISFLNDCKNKESDFLVVIDYGKILPQAILETPKIASIGIHFSLLPKWRGAAPAREAIKNGDEFSGTSIMKLNKKLDAGDILAQKKIKIEP